MKLPPKDTKLFVVQVTDGLFGEFLFTERLSTMTVAERSDRRAVRRAWEKGLGRRDHPKPDREIEECWATYRVREKSKADKDRNYEYFY